MRADRVRCEWLLEALQRESIECGECCRVLECVRTVGIDRERDVVADLGAHRGNDRDIGTGFDLQLDPAVALGAVRRGERAELLLVVGEADRDAGLDRRTRAAQVRNERLPGRAQLRVEQRGFERGPGERVAAHVREVVAREGARHEVVAQHEPRAVERLAGVARRRFGRALAPSVRVGGDGMDEQRVFVRRGAACSAERSDERQSDADELDRAERPGHIRPGPVRAHNRTSDAWRSSSPVPSWPVPSSRPPSCAGAFLAGAFFGRRLAGEDRVLERLERRDARHALGRDLHHLAGRWVARHASGAVDATELREAGDRDVLAAGNGLRDQFEE